MKKSFSFVLVAASLLLASAAQAQSVHVRADVPFNFSIGKTIYEAGSYDIRNLGDGKVLRLTNGDNATVAISHDCESAQLAQKTVLVFRETETGYALYQIWTEGNNVGREFSQAKPQMQLAGNEKPREVIIAANIVK